VKRTVLVLALVLSTVALTGAACGSSSDNNESSPSSSKEAVAEIDEVKTLLDQALTDYRNGETKAADTKVGDAYLEHFEKVEHPLGERDHELNEELEERISTDIRTKMKEGSPASDVAALVDETKADLDTAKTKLQEAQ
jgi:hypothetical protein